MKRESVVVRARKERERKTAERKAEREKRKISFVDEGAFDIKRRDMNFTVGYAGDMVSLDQGLDYKIYKGDI